MNLKEQQKSLEIAKQTEEAKQLAKLKTDKGNRTNTTKSGTEWHQQAELGPK